MSRVDIHVNCQVSNRLVELKEESNADRITDILNTPMMFHHLFTFGGRGEWSECPFNGELTISYRL